MNLKLLAVAINCVLVFVVGASPVSADIVACPSGNFSTVDYTTCDIGNLQFTFTGLVSETSPSGTAAWTDRDFIFTVLSNGFELSGPPAQTITAPSGGDEYYHDSAAFNYSVTDLNGLITGVDVSGGNPSVSGPGTSGDITDASNYIFLENASQLVSDLNIVSRGRTLRFECRPRRHSEYPTAPPLIFDLAKRRRPRCRNPAH